MPVGVVKTKADEKKWERAKKACKEQYGKVKYPVVMTIFQNMKGSKPPRRTKPKRGQKRKPKRKG